MGGATFFMLPGDLPFFVQYRNKWMLPSPCRVTTLYRATFQLMDGFALVFLIFLQLSK